MPNTESHNTPGNKQDIFESLSSQDKDPNQLNDLIISCNNIDKLKQAEKEVVEKITTYEFSWDENMNVMSDLLNRLHDKIQGLESQASQENNNNNPLVQNRQQQENNSRIIRNETKISQQKYTQQSKSLYIHNTKRAPKSTSNIDKQLMDSFDSFVKGRPTGDQFSRKMAANNAYLIHVFKRQEQYVQAQLLSDCVVCVKDIEVVKMFAKLLKPEVVTETKNLLQKRLNQVNHNSSSNNKQNIPTMQGVVSTPPQINNKPQHVNQMMGIKTLAPSDQANNKVEALDQLTISNNDEIATLRQRKSVLQQRINGAYISLKEYWNAEEELRKIKQKLNAIDNKPMPNNNNNNNNNNFNNIPIDIGLDQIQNDDDKLDNSVSNSYKNINLPELVKSYDKSLLKTLKHSKDSKQGKEEIRQFKSTYPDIHAYLYGQAIYGGDRPQLLLKAEEHSVALRFIRFLRAKLTGKEIREVIAKNDNQVIKILQSQNIKTQAQAIYFAFQNISPQPFKYFLSFFNDKSVLELSKVEIKRISSVSSSKLKGNLAMIDAKLEQLQPQVPISLLGKRTRLQNSTQPVVQKAQKLNTGGKKYHFFSNQPPLDPPLNNVIKNSNTMNTLQK